MECNKDEAVRAKQIAESKMQSGDFVGALKIAKKAQKLFPDMENVAQILTVCEVHCAAVNKLTPSEMDWYGILQTERFADEAVIKKQYKKLALLLHPDKNKFGGAEAAFKMIGEANRVLTDQAKRSLYDVKCKASVRATVPKPPAHQSNGTARNFQSSSYSQPTRQNSHQQAERQTFWTSCQHCNTMFQYHRIFVNSTLRCQHCSKLFTAHSQKAPQQWKPKVAPHTNGGKPCVGKYKDKFMQSDPVSMRKCSTGAGVQSNSEKSKDGYVTAGAAKVYVGMSKSAASRVMESQPPTYVGSKRARQSVLDSRESSKFGSVNDMKDANVWENGPDPLGLNGGMHPRRPSRREQHVSYMESFCSDDFESPLKWPPQNGSSNTIDVEEKEEGPLTDGLSKSNPGSSAAHVRGHNGEVKTKGSGPPEEALLKKSTVEPSQACEENPSDHVMYPHPEFNDFEKAEDCFSVNQIWACYDPVDGMPRSYACVKEVLSPRFKLLITWLDAEPDGQSEIDWCNGNLPVACGKFKLGASEEVEDHLMFSHQVGCIKGSGSDTYLVYPKKGEIWAIFKDWDIGWSIHPEEHLNYEFEFVEVQSDFGENVGIEVAYLGKVKGFVSLFCKTEQNGISLFRVPPNELYKFSHRIPYFKMTGHEREGVPGGCFELDPAGLPLNLLEVGSPLT